jgi:hypothetical protein
MPEEDGPDAGGFAELWSRQDEQTYDLDYQMYNTKPWMLLKLVLGLVILVLIYLLYALQELPWSIFGHAAGLVLLGVVPLFVGLIIGFSFDSAKKALALAIPLGFAAMAVSFFIFRYPYTMNMAEYHPGFMLNVWFYSFIWFIITITFVPAGAAVAAASNQYE